MTVAGRAGVRHLTILAQRARDAGGEGEAAARAYATQVLRDAGFTTQEAPFTYSAFPARFATPLAGGLLAGTIVSASFLALNVAQPRSAGIVLGTGALVTALFATIMLRGVLTLPWLRARGINLVATRAMVPPRVWIVAHLDSKSQPVPSILRVAGVLTLSAASALAAAAELLTLGGHEIRTLWWGAVAAALAGALPVVASVVGERSDGAVDNASGVAAVLTAAAMLPQDSACGVLLTSAEELGLAGARAWALGQSAPGTALNCDGVDDDGDVVIMYNGTRPPVIVDAVRRATARTVRVRRMPLGLLTDSSALSANGWVTATVSHGSLATLRRIHTSRDSLRHLRGTSIDEIATLLSHAAEALAQ